MNMLQFIRSDVESVISQVNTQKSVAEGIADNAKKFMQIVMGSWIGGDEQAFSNAVNTKLLPAIAELMAAIAGISLNLGKGINIMDAADKAVKGEADALNSIFSQI